MELSPEERQRVYEEEHERREVLTRDAGRKRRVLVGACLIVAAMLLVAYVLLRPYFVLGEISSAAKSGDTQRLAELVDFPALRENLKAQFNATLMMHMTLDLQDNPFAGLGMMLGSALVERMVDAFVSPSGLAAVTSGQRPSIDSSAEQPPNTTEEPTAKPQLSYKYRSPSWVQAEVREHPDSTAIASFTIRRRGLTWRLTAIELPSLAENR